MRQIIMIFLIALCIGFLLFFYRLGYSVGQRQVKSVEINQSQLYKPPEEKRNVKELCSDWIAVTDGIIE